MNNFFSQCAEAKRIPNIFVSIPLFIAFLLLGSITAELLYQFTGLRNLLSPFWNTVYFLIISFGLMNLFLWLWIRFGENRVFSSIGFRTKSFIKEYLFGLGSGIGAITLIILLMLLFDLVSVETETTVKTGSEGLVFSIIMLIGFMIQGGTEEIITRGWFMQVIGSRYKPWIAILVSSLVFAGLHSMNSGATFLSIFNLAIFALILAFYIVYKGNIIAACGFHSAWNWSMGNFYGLNVSGSLPKGGSIIQLKVHGSELFSGGRFGPEGSILTTIVLVTMVLIMIYLYRTSKKTQ